VTVTENAPSLDLVLAYLEREQAWNSRHSGRNQLAYKVLKLAQIVFAATIPVLAAIGVSSWTACGCQNSVRLPIRGFRCSGGGARTALRRSSHRRCNSRP